jgi:hypothetical protein
MKESRGSLS